MENAAPFADTAIPLYLGSINGMRYRTLNCMECGREFLERNADVMYRIGDSTAPNEVTISATAILAHCGQCRQAYTVQFSLNSTYIGLVKNAVPRRMQPESIYVAVEREKSLRKVHCMECGKTFHRISDRIQQVVDNHIPFEFLDPEKHGPLEALCDFPQCGQTWVFMV